MNRERTIQIILPAYNAARWIEETLESLRAQTFDDWRALVVDDGSTDDTAARVAALARMDARIEVVTQANGGPSRARNNGFAQSEPSIPIVLFLDTDDVLEPDALQILVDALTAAPDCVGAYGLARSINAKGDFIEPGVLEMHQRERWGIDGGGHLTRWLPEQPTTFAVEAVFERIITSGTVLIRREALEKSGLFAPDLSLWEDWDLWLRLTRVGPLAFVPQPVLRYRRHDTNLSGPSADLDAGERRIRARLLASLQNDPAHYAVALAGQKAARRLLLRQRLRWAAHDCRDGKPVPALKHLYHAGGLLLRK